MHVLAEAELTAVELDRGVDVVDDVTDAYFGHLVSSGPGASDCKKHGTVDRPGQSGAYAISAVGWTSGTSGVHPLARSATSEGGVITMARSPVGRWRRSR